MIALSAGALFVLILIFVAYPITLVGLAAGLIIGYGLHGWMGSSPLQKKVTEFADSIFGI
jgi:hypothetical protein